MKPKHIIAIGGSAGSLNPLKTFFDHTPLDSAAYVVIQHLPLHFQSHLREILQKHSKLDIVVATEGMALKENVVYLTPTSKQLFIDDSILKTEARLGGPNFTIDRFLKSLGDCALSPAEIPGAIKKYVEGIGPLQ